MGDMIMIAVAWVDIVAMAAGRSLKRSGPLILSLIIVFVAWMIWRFHHER